jgi:hypothetical protein
MPKSVEIANKRRFADFQPPVGSSSPRLRRSVLCHWSYYISFVSFEQVFVVFSSLKPSMGCSP